MKALVKQAEEILDVAFAAREVASAEFAILFTRDGGMRILEGAGWGPLGLLAEYGASSVFLVERRGAKVRVEGWSGTGKCVLERETPRVCYATRSQVIPLAIAGSNECSPRVLNSYLSM